MLDDLPNFQIHRNNYSSVTDNLPEACNLIDSQVALGVMEPDVCRPLITHPLGLVGKKLEPGQTGPPKFRMITDARTTGLKDCIRDCPFPLPSIHDVVSGARVNWWAAKYDLKDGFYHIPVHNLFVDLLGVRHPSRDSYARYRFLSFGLQCAPFYFQGTMCELRRMFIEMGIIGEVSFVYIDDWLLLAPSRELLIAQMEAFEATMALLGFILHPTKRAGPLQCIEYIGLVLNFALATLTITAERCESLHKHVECLLHDVVRGDWAVAAMDTVIGKLLYVACVVVGGRAALTPLYEARRVASLSWRNPQGKPPHDARIVVAARGHHARAVSQVDGALQAACKRGLRFWLSKLTHHAPPHRRLFVYED